MHLVGQPEETKRDEKREVRKKIRRFTSHPNSPAEETPPKP